MMTTHERHCTWDGLIGARVEIWRSGQFIRAGIVDDVMPDSSAIWLAQEGVNPRMMFEAALLYEVWVGLAQQVLL